MQLQQRFASQTERVCSLWTLQPDCHMQPRSAV